MSPTPQELGYPLYRREEDLKSAPDVLSQTVTDLKGQLKKLVKEGVSPDKIKVAGLVIEPLREAVRGKVGHCVHLVIKETGLEIQNLRGTENPDALSITTGIIYDDKISLRDFTNSCIVNWGSQAGTRSYRRVNPSFLERIPSSFFYNFLESNFYRNDGYFAEFYRTVKLADLVSKITKLCGDNNEAILAISDGIKTAHGI